MLFWFASHFLLGEPDRIEIVATQGDGVVDVRLVAGGGPFASLRVPGRLERGTGSVLVVRGQDRLEFFESGERVLVTKRMEGRSFGLGATETWSIPGKTVYSEGGVSTEWTSPATMVQSGDRLVVLAPVLPKQLSDQVLEPLVLDGLEVGLARVKMVRGSLRRVSVDRPLGPVTQYSYSLSCRTGGTVSGEVSRMWREYQPAHASQAFPQCLPFGIAIARTTTFSATGAEIRAMDLGGEEIVGPVGMRWQTFDGDAGRTGWPRGQEAFEFGTVSNALRAGLGVPARETGVVKPGQGRPARFEENVTEQVARRLVSASPSGQFVAVCGTQGGPGKVGSLDEQAATAVFALQALGRTKDGDLAKGLRSRAEAVGARILRSGRASAVQACLLFDLMQDGSWSGNRPAAARLVAAAKSTVLLKDPERLAGVGWNLELLARAGTADDARKIQDYCLKLCSHQCLWDRPTDGIAPTFGSFSDRFGGIDTESGVISAGLIKVGIKYLHLELVDRGAFGIRNQFGLWNSSPSPVGLAAQLRMHLWHGTEGLRMGDFTARRNWESGEGLKAALLGEVLGVGGGYVVTRDGSVGIDGTSDDGGKLRYTLATNPLPNPSDAIGPAFGPDSSIFPSRPFELFQVVTSLRVGSIGIGKAALVATPTAGSTGLPASGRFRAEGWEVVAGSGADGWSADWPEGGRGGVVEFSAGAGLRREAALFAAPALEPDLVWPAGWRRMGENWWVQRASVVTEDGLWVSTGDDGCGGESLVYRCRAATPAFWCGDVLVDVWLRGGGGCRVEVFDADSGEILQVEEATSLQPERVTLNFTGLEGRRIAVRLVDESRIGLVAMRMASD